MFEIAVTEECDLDGIFWQEVDASLYAREQSEDLKSVEVVFLDTIPMTIAGGPETLRPGINLKEDLMKRMPMTVNRGLMKCSPRGLCTLW